MFYLLVVLWGMSLQAENPWFGLSDGVKDVLVGKMHKNLPALQTKEAFPWLMEENKKKLLADLLTLEDAETQVCAKFKAFLEEQEKLQDGWVHSVDDIRLLAEKINPESRELQMHSVIHMILFYVQEALKNNIHNTMFGGAEMPNEDIARFSPAVWGVNWPFGAEYRVGPKMRYMMRDSYEFSMLEWFCAEEEDMHLLVIPRDWTKEWKAHRDVFKGLFHIVKSHDGAHADILESFSVFMNNIADNFSEKRNKAIRETLYEMWETRGPQAIVGGFFLFHEVEMKFVDAQDDIWAGSLSVEEKVISILKSLSKRGVNDEGLLDLLKIMGLGDVISSDDVLALAGEFLEIFLKNFKNGPALHEAPNPQKLIEDEWLGGQDLRLVGLQGLAKALSPDIDAEGLFPVRFDDRSPIFMPVQEKGILLRSYMVKTSNKLRRVVFVPTREVWASYTNVQKRWMIQEWSFMSRVFEGYEWQESIPVAYTDLAPLSVLKSLPPLLMQKLFGDGVVAEGIMTPKKISLFRELAMVKLNKDNIAGVLLLNIIEQLKGTGFNDHITQLFEQMQEEGVMGQFVLAILGDLYLDAHLSGRSQDPVIKLFAGPDVLTKKDIEEFILPNGQYFLQEAKTYTKSAPQFVCLSRQATMLEKVIALEKQVVIIENVGLQAGVLYKQCADAQKSYEYRLGWIVQGSDFLSESVKIIWQNWHTIGLYGLLGEVILYEVMVDLPQHKNFDDVVVALKDIRGSTEAGIAAHIIQREPKLVGHNISQAVRSVCLSLIYNATLNYFNSVAFSS